MSISTFKVCECDCLQCTRWRWLPSRDDTTGWNGDTPPSTASTRSASDSITGKRIALQNSLPRGSGTHRQRFLNLVAQDWSITSSLWSDSPLHPLNWSPFWNCHPGMLHYKKQSIRASSSSALRLEKAATELWSGSNETQHWVSVKIFPDSPETWSHKVVVSNYIIRQIFVQYCNPDWIPTVQFMLLNFSDNVFNLMFIYSNTCDLLWGPLVLQLVLLLPQSHKCMYCSTTATRTSIHLLCLVEKFHLLKNSVHLEKRPFQIHN